LPQASSDTPGGFGRAALERLPIRSCSGWGLPRGRCHHRPGEPLPHRFTLTASALASGRGGLFSVALSSGSPPPAVGWHPALWSSDFPLVTRARARVTSDHPSLSDAPRMTDGGEPSTRDGRAVRRSGPHSGRRKRSTKRSLVPRRSPASRGEAFQSWVPRGSRGSRPRRRARSRRRAPRRRRRSARCGGASARRSCRGPLPPRDRRCRRRLRGAAPRRRRRRCGSTAGSHEQRRTEEAREERAGAESASRVRHHGARTTRPTSSQGGARRWERWGRA
jgi:hypothetical protein